MKDEQQNAYDWLQDQMNKVIEGFWGEDDDFDYEEFAEDLISHLEERDEI